jgi:hypothetical protein
MMLPPLRPGFHWERPTPCRGPCACTGACKRPRMVPNRTVPSVGPSHILVDRHELTRIVRDEVKKAIREIGTANATAGAEPGTPEATKK